MSGHRQLTRSGTSAWGLGKELTTPHCKKPGSYTILHRTSGMDRYFGVTCAMEYEHEIWKTECY